MKPFLILLPLLYFACNIFTFCKLWKALHVPLVWKIIAGALFCCIASAFIVAMFLRDSKVPYSIASTLYTAGSLWMIFVILCAVFCVVFDLLHLFFPALKGGLWYSAGIAAAVVACGYINYVTPQVVELGIKVDKPLKVKVRIVAVSDMHLGLGTGKKMLGRFVETINAQSPDLILILGDLVDNSTTPLFETRMYEELSMLHAPMGIYMIAGNHEYISDINSFCKFIEKTNIEFIRDSVVSLPCGVELIMRDDMWSKNRMELKDIYSLADTKKPTILLEHEPYKIKEKDAMGVDIILSGHTHNGQVWPGNLVVAQLYEQAQGYRKWDHSHVWVSSGLSLWGPPVRIGTKGDIAVITLEGTKERDNSREGTAMPE